MGAQQSNDDDDRSAWSTQQAQRPLPATAVHCYDRRHPQQRHQQWALDLDHATCMGCAKPFTWFRRRHHCRKCGGVFCDACCPVVPRATVVGALCSSRSTTDDDLAAMLLSMGSPRNERSSSSGGGIGGSTAAWVGGTSSARLTGTSSAAPYAASTYGGSARRSSRTQVSSLQPGVGSELRMSNSGGGGGGGSYASFGRRTNSTSELGADCSSSRRDDEAPTPLSNDDDDDDGRDDRRRPRNEVQRQPPSPTTTRVCRRCTCPLLSQLSDALLTYVMRFLRYDAQDKMMRTCTRLLLAVYVPFRMLYDLGDLFSWREPEDVLHLTDSTMILRVTERRTGSPRCLHVFIKRQLISRRLWRQLQRYVDILSDVASHRAFPHLYNVVQTRDVVAVVMELVDLRRYVPLSELLVDDGESVGQASSGSPSPPPHCGHTVAAGLPKMMYNAALAVEHLHIRLHVAHRRLTPSRLMVEVIDARWLLRADATTDSNGGGRPEPSSSPSTHHPPSCDVVLLGLRHGRILGDGKLPSGTSFLKQRHLRATAAAAAPSSSAAAVDADAGGRGALNEVDDNGGVGVAHPRVVRRRPPPIPIPVDRALLRKSLMYRKAAEQRNASLAAGRQTRNHFSAVDAQPIPVRILSSVGGGGAAVDVLGSGGGAGFLISSAILQSESLLLSPKDQRVQEMRVVDDGVMPVVTPRGAGTCGFTCPEVARILDSREVVVPSLAQTGRDVKAWDLYALGVVNLLGLHRYLHFFLVDGDDHRKKRNTASLPAHATADDAVASALSLYDRIVAALRLQAASAAEGHRQRAQHHAVTVGSHPSHDDVRCGAGHAAPPAPLSHTAEMTPEFVSALLAWAVLVLRLLSPDPMDRGDITTTVAEMRDIHTTLHLCPVPAATATLSPPGVPSGDGPPQAPPSVYYCVQCSAAHHTAAATVTATTAVGHVGRGATTNEGEATTASLVTPSAPPPAPRHAQQRSMATATFSARGSRGSGGAEAAVTADGSVQVRSDMLRTVGRPGPSYRVVPKPREE